jgi:hypothetical protein
LTHRFPKVQSTGKVEGKMDTIDENHETVTELVEVTKQGVDFY